MSTDSSGPSDSSQPPRKRRPRYKGTHPRRFEEKYKEKDPEAYRDTAEKIIAKGGTPAGTHRPIMVDEILEFLALEPGQIAVDCTLGYGGHAGEMLARLLSTGENGNNGKLVAFDRDPLERPKTEERLRKRFPEAGDSLVIVGADYAQAERHLTKLGLMGQVDAVLADLGLSSMQIDDPSRGFTFKTEGPLDLRMNPELGEPAWRLLEDLDEEALAQLLEENSDEPRAKWCAKAILDWQKRSPIRTTTDLASAIRAWLKTLSPRTQAAEGDTPIRRAFQALRIAVNDEFRSLDRLLEALPRIVKPGGRIAFLSFHSGEDRRVKKAFQAGYRYGDFSWVSPDVVRPSLEEQKANSRSKSAKLRCAIRSN